MVVTVTMSETRFNRAIKHEEIDSEWDILKPGFGFVHLQKKMSFGESVKAWLETVIFNINHNDRIKIRIVR